jgi:hypothetical protein
MSNDERRRELERIHGQQDGPERLTALYVAACGSPPPPEMNWLQQIDAIVAKEAAVEGSAG